MIPFSFNLKKEVSLKCFLKEIKNGNRNILSILGTPETHFVDAAFNELMANESDVLSGVNKVKKNFSDLYFGLFDGCLIKHHDNGDIKFVFFTTTYLAEKVIEIASDITSELGPGMYDDEKHRSFREIDKIERLSNRFFVDETDDHVQVWRYEELVFLLQYRTTPLCQLSLMITITPSRQIDRSIRRKGTIVDVLNFNIHDLLNKQESSSQEYVENGIVKFIDYKYDLLTLELNSFNKISIRVFSEVKSFQPEIQTSVTLYSNNLIRFDKKIEIVEKIIKIYGQDDGGNGDLEFYERDILEANEFWTGRTWTFNESHGIWKTSNNNEKFSYQVALHDFEDEIGFNICILGFNNLVSLFTA